MNVQTIGCNWCNKTFRDNSENYYWHLKIHNAELERLLLENKIADLSKDLTEK